MPKPSPAPCPCGGASYAACCARYLDDGAAAPSAEALMRSRYTAFTLRREAYLRATWHASTRPTGPLIDSDEKLQWLGLEVKSALRLRQRKAGDPDVDASTPASKGADHDADRDSVEFVARYRLNGRAHRLHEISRFVREGGHWFYVDGSFPT